MRQGDVIAVLEAIYAEGGDEGDWLQGIVDAAAPTLDRSFGCIAYLYDARGARFRAWEVRTTSDAVEIEAVRRVVTHVDPAYVERSWKRLDVATASEVAGSVDAIAATPGFGDRGVRDVLAINAYDPSGVGCWLGALQPDVRRLRSQERAAYRRVAAHLAAGFRLRRGVAKVEAVLSTSGAVVDAVGEEAKRSSARAALHAAAEHMERARGPMRRADPDGALLSWRTLVQARWSLVDHFERGGKRYLVALANEPAPPAVPVLPLRERQVMELVAQGHTTKVIGYELGLSDSTVRVLLNRASRRLGARDRSAAVERYRAIVAAGLAGGEGRGTGDA